ncbi:MAG: hypothetical protein U1F49_11080 [Rubrivivax sp.]
MLPLGSDIGKGMPGPPTTAASADTRQADRRTAASTCWSGNEGVYGNMQMDLEMWACACATASTPTAKAATASGRSTLLLPGACRPAGGRHAARDGPAPEPARARHMMVYRSR